MLTSGYRVLIWLAACGLTALFSPAIAAVTADDLVKVVEKAKILSPEYQVRASVGAGEAQISTYRNPKAGDKDCKIDAVLIAKEVMQADPSGITRVIVRFYDTTNVSRFREVSVRQGDVKAFGSRQMSPDELLSSIDIRIGDVNAGRTPAKAPGGVVEGPLAGERIQLLGRIQSLRDRGVGVKPFMVLFADAEEQAKNGDKRALTENLNALNAALNNAEESYNQFHRKSGPYSSAPRGSQGNFPGGDMRRLGSPGMGGVPGNNGQMQKPPANQMEMMKQQLGDLAPAMGPMLKRRYAVARRILDLKDQGRVVDYYMRLYRDIENAAGRQDMPSMQMKLRIVEHELGIPSMEME